MRASSVVCVFALAMGHIANAKPRPLDDEIASATAVGKPLVIEIGATWCGPCRSFAQNILPALDVRAALENVWFVHYDVDAAPGDAIAEHYHVAAFPSSRAPEVRHMS